MLFREVLSSVSNDSVYVNDLVTLDVERKVLVYTEPGIRPDSTVGTLEVPTGFNIFRLLNMTDHPADVDGWSVVLKNDSDRYEVLEDVFMVRTGGGGLGWGGVGVGGGKCVTVIRATTCFICT